MHVINPVRLRHVNDRVGGIAAKKVLDAGCGGGILTESLAKEGAKVTGIDTSKGAIERARKHAAQGDLDIDYLVESCQSHAATRRNAYDVVTCMEMIEHVEDPAVTIAQLSSVLRTGGSLVLSTINRTPLAGAVMIGALERVAGVIDRGTHNYEMFRTPTEVGRWCEDSGLVVLDATGANWSFFGKTFLLSKTFMPVNYFLHAKKP